jgi:hypothetical protein
MGLEVGGVLWCWGLQGHFLSCGCAGVGVGAGIITGSSWWGPGARSSLLSVPAIIHSPYPTCKQVLAAVGMGGGLAFSILGGLSASVTWRTDGVHWLLTKWVSPSWGRHQHRSTHHPPHEQLLMGLEVGGVSRCWGLWGHVLLCGCAGVSVGAGIITGLSW